MIEGVKITPLRQIVDERGKIMHMLRCDSEIFSSFGEIYFSWIDPLVVKAWHYHHEMVLNYAVPVGKIKLTLFDDRPNSSTRGKIQEIYMGPDNYSLVTVPAKVWNGFKGLGTTPSMVANCSTIPHHPNEIERKDPINSDIPYDWKIVHC